jgi:hypothetical protein
LRFDAVDDALELMAITDSDAAGREDLRLTKSQIAALIDLAYGGIANRAVLIRTTSILRGHTRGRGSIAVHLSTAQKSTLIEAASSGRRVEGLTDAVKPLLFGFESARTRKRTVVNEQPLPGKRGRRCGLCHKLRPESEFVSRRDQRCSKCRGTIEKLTNASSDAPTQKSQQNQKSGQRKSGSRRGKGVKRKRKYDDRDKSVSIRTVSGGLPTLGKRR